MNRPPRDEELVRSFAAGDRVSVMTKLPVDGPFDYLAPDGGVSVGDYVRVPIGPRSVVGVVWDKGGNKPLDRNKVRAIESRIDVPPMHSVFMKFLERAAGYNLASVNAMLRLTRLPESNEALPTRLTFRLSGTSPKRMTAPRARVIEALEQAGARGLAAASLQERAETTASVISGLRKQGVIVADAVPSSYRLPKLNVKARKTRLNAEQRDVSRQFVARAQQATYQTVLLKGVPGAGKTEVYLEAVAATIRSGRQVLVLLPEIALTVQFLERVAERFGSPPLQWHSGITKARKKRVWTLVGSGRAQLVVGARSALFLPFTDLGLIVVDEEHDRSFKQSEGVIYHARDMAVLRGSMSGSLVILSSATPSLESWINARDGKYGRLDMVTRYGSAAAPVVDTIDMRSESLPRGRWISRVLAGEIQLRLRRHQQSLLFLNRRGFAPLTICRACGHQISCSECDVTLTEHRFVRELQCHQCGLSTAVPETCPHCDVAGKLAPIGPGVERLAEEVASLFPDAKLEVLSSDLVSAGDQLRERIGSITSGDVDIVVGTQIIAKGHNFPHLSLAAVIDADMGLQGADIRAAEHCFQLIRQVAGRSGRIDLEGVALLQTWQPEHPIMQAIVSGDDEKFWTTEAAEREIAGIPPFGQYVGIVVSGSDIDAVRTLSMEMARLSGPLDGIGAELFGPAPAPIMRIRGRVRFRLLIKAERSMAVQAATASWLGQFKIPGSIRLTVDVDPHDFL